MELLSLHLENFMGVRDLTLDFGGKSAGIYGDNATGKTTVCTAVTWLLFGSAPIKGFNPKTRDASGEVHNLSHRVEGVFDTGRGPVILCKSFSEVWKKMRGTSEPTFSGHTTEYFVDGVPKTEREYTATIDRLCGDGKKALMLTSPEYFAEVLTWDARRKILLDVCGDVSDEDIVAGNAELAELPDFLASVDVGGYSTAQTPESYRLIAESQRRKLNAQLSEVPARIDEAVRAVPDLEGVDRTVVKNRLASLSDELARLNAEKAAAELRTDNGEANAQRTKIAELRALASQTAAEITRKAAEENASVDADVARLNESVREIRRERTGLEDQISELTRKKMKLEAKRDELRDEYKRVFAEQWKPQATVCPTCGRPFDNVDNEADRQAFNERRSARLSEITQRGRTEASAAMIAELESQTDELIRRCSEISDRESDLRDKADDLARRRVIIDPFRAPEYLKIAREIDAAEAELAVMSTTARAPGAEFDAAISAVRTEIEKVRSLIASFDLADRMTSRVSELEKQEKDLNAALERVEKGLYLCDLFTRCKCAALSERINGRFRSVRFSLFKEQINGGVKDDCDVLIPTADGRLIPWAYANHAARVNAGLEIISVLSDAFGIRMPVLIDNAESVTHLATADTQVIRLVVSESDKKLRMEIEE